MVTVLPTNEDVLKFVLGAPYNYSINQSRVIHGHQPMSLWLDLELDLLFTVLRDPIQRVISAYNYVWRKPDHILHNQFQNNQIGLALFATHKTLSYHSSNLQTRMLGLRADFASIVNQLQSQQISLFKAQEIFRDLINVVCDEKMLDKAITTLSEDVCFTITNRLDAAMSDLANYIGIPNKSSGIRINAAPTVSTVHEFPAIQDWEIEVVKKQNELDIQLFQAALELLKDKPMAGVNGQ